MRRRGKFSLLISLLLVLCIVGRKGKQAQIQMNTKRTAAESRAFKKAIRETVWVETSVDSDHDGKKDRVKVDIIRPKETKKGIQVPVIYNMSPYNAGLVYPDYYNVDEELHCPGPSFTNEYHYDKYFVPRGYAMVNASSIGSKGSDGCPTTGDPQELLAAKAVIDWLNGRAEGFDESGNNITAYWTNGKTGMVGLSYEGTIPNGLATLDVPGLKTIVPIGAISNWYDYYRANGAVIAPGGYQGDDADRLAKGVLTRDNPEVCMECMEQMEKDQDRKTGDYNAFWDERNYLNGVHNLQASVFLVHGLNDMNVKRKQFAQWWEKLKQYDVPRKLWLHNGGHIDPKVTSGDKWLTTLHRWFDYWLYDKNNGVMDEAQVTIQQPDDTWIQQTEWPHKDAHNTLFYLGTDQSGRGALQEFEEVSEEEKATFTDNAFIKAEQLVKKPEVMVPHRLAYMTSKLTRPVRLSGFPQLSIQASIDQTAANLTALLVDYGPDETTIVTRGWMDACNVDSIWQSKALEPGRLYNFEWDMEPHDYKFEKGHQIGLVLMSSDYEYTIRPKTSVSITVHYGKSHVILPLVDV
ncbi:Xaa-Pro dipeptidyl-peptidase [Virgibacillus halodenitrificans]|uniref:Xaa-Pro dipeptidyl-peptidase n=1 Tax=Virgibacillus halodenitrificans TaxID=1482 RepID=UPI0024BFC1EB|nr:Xaa-Pro dipeptidyl-peptidase [Virgibacillus halodenitrificans]WHX26301.1 Xaa-Pro dipeptidyl-peptidase [Virgibacillus halodenitrificans]